MEPYSIFIPCAPKDFLKLQYVIGSVQKNLHGFDDIHISVPDLECGGAVSVPWDGRPIHFHRDRDVLDFDISRFRYRPNWVYQQFLKLFQNVTKYDLYLTIDADVIINRAMPLFNWRGQRIWWRGWEQHHEPYYEFNRAMLGLEKVFDGTFLCDLNFLDRKIIQKMVPDVYGFMARASLLIDSACHPSEADMFGQYCAKWRDGLYEIREARLPDQKYFAKHVASFSENAWTTEDIEAKIAEMKTKDVDLFAMHSWFTNDTAQT